MAHLIVRHKVQDYEKWRPFFDQDASARKMKGSKGAQVMRNADDPNEIVLVFEWDTVQHARDFAHAPELREVMGKAGVADMPTIWFLDDVGHVAF